MQITEALKSSTSFPRVGAFQIWLCQEFSRQNAELKFLFDYSANDWKVILPVHTGGKNCDNLESNKTRVAVSLTKVRHEIFESDNLLSSGCLRQLTFWAFAWFSAIRRVTLTVASPRPSPV